MGQKSNTTTLRIFKNNLLINDNPKLLFLIHTILRYYFFLFKEKKITLVDCSLNFSNNVLYIYFKLFYTTEKLNKTKKYLNKNKKKKSSSFILNKLNRLLKLNIINIKTVILNKKIDKYKSKIYFFKLRKYLNSLFSKRFNLYIDFIKITALLDTNKIKSKIFLEFLSRIFSFLHKKNHNKFLIMLKNLFTQLIKTSKNIQGIKLEVSGKIQGKAIASTQKLIVGNISVQTLKKNVNLEKNHVYTSYGVFGLKLWIYNS